MRLLGQLLSVITWLLVAGSVIVLAGGLFGRPLLLAAVPTGSMVPAFHPGDLIVVLPTWLMPGVARGDIIVFKLDGSSDHIVHRIIDGDEMEGFVTKGDANPVSDAERVSPPEIVGVVPQVSGSALHMPRLGLLSLEQGPISSPVVAGVALMMGLFLLFMDARPTLKLPRMKRARREPAGGVLSLYLGLAGTVFLVTLIPAWTLSTQHRVRYEVVTEKPASDSLPGRYLLGRPGTEGLTVHNSSPLPVLIIFRSADPALTYEPVWAIAPARGEVGFLSTANNPELGPHDAEVRMGVFLPLLPPALLARLAGVSIGLAALATALVPAAVILLLAMSDTGSRTALLRIRIRTALRLPL